MDVVTRGIPLLYLSDVFPACCKRCINLEMVTLVDPNVLAMTPCCTTPTLCNMIKRGIYSWCFLCSVSPVLFITSERAFRST